MQISELEPKKVFHFFEELSKIPHGSGNTEQISNYCIDFAKKRGLRSFRDEYGNVMLFKDGTKGYEDSQSVIIQGHLDMVCEKLPDCERDMEKEGIELVTDGEYIWADGTTLGGDDGIAIAYALALLDSDDIKHPPIEAVFTLDEETGLRGANYLDASQLKGKLLINIDSEEEGILTVSCAGGVRAMCEIPVTIKAVSDEGTTKICTRKITLEGLRGGHSGIDIDKHRKNAAKLLCELLYELDKKIGIEIAYFSAGGRLNVIPPSAQAVVCFDAESERIFDETVAAFSDMAKKSLDQTEPNLRISCVGEAIPNFAANAESTEKLIFALMQVFDGVYEMNPAIPELVQTSSNLGSVSFENGALKLGIMIRSNTGAGKAALVSRLESLVGYLDGRVSLEDDYPAWEYCNNSPLRDTMSEAYREMYGTEPQISSIHAGLECGILSDKLHGADMVSIGPDMEMVHTPKERLSVKSSERVWEYLIRVLEKLK